MEALRETIFTTVLSVKGSFNMLHAATTKNTQAFVYLTFLVCK